MFGHSYRLLFIIISLILLNLFASTIEGKSLLMRTFTHDKSTSTYFPQVAKNQDKLMVVRGAIGSSPPRCEGKCKSCKQCEAVQVPIVSPCVSNIEYMPITWKCKCGTSLFNP